MPSINMQKCFVRNEQLKHYPKVSIDSIPSRFKLMISSTSNFYGKCLFVIMMFSLDIFAVLDLLYISFDSIYSAQLQSFHAILGHLPYLIFYFRYDHKLVKQIEEHWNALQIDFDYETRKYFWTYKAFYRWLTYFMYIIAIIIIYFNQSSMQMEKDKIISSEVVFRENIKFYYACLIIGPLAFLNFFCNCCIQMDLPILAQTAVQFNLIKLKKLLNESLKAEKSLNIDDIQNIRHKYLLSCRLVDKINEIMSPCLVLAFTHFVANGCALAYTMLYTQPNQLTSWSPVIISSFFFTTSLILTRSALKINEKSLESLAIVYKLSLKTNSIRILNEISLFLNHNEIGFTFGGMFMLTTSSLSTLYSAFITIVLAIPSFSR
uniref:Gustatory receptor n=1 Tax=Tetranychus urticae TaxID=32264 RepID=T1KJ78_TETUR